MTREEKRIYCCFYSGSCDVMRARCRYEVTQVTDFTRTADDFMKPSTQREKDIKEQFGSFFVGFVFGDVRLQKWKAGRPERRLRSEDKDPY